jgi:hypothetical protein
MNPYLAFYIECLKVYAGERELTPTERRAHFIVVTGGKAA